MKKPFKKKPAEPVRRERQRKESPRAGAQGFSYYSRRSDQDFGSATGRQSSHEAVPHSKIRLQQAIAQRLKFIALFVGLFISAFAIITLSGNAKIEPLRADATTLRDTSAYQTAANDFLSGSIANKTKLTIDSKKISAELQAKFPELTSVSVAVPLLAHRPIVYIDTAQPALVLSASSGSFVVGTSGTILASSSQVASSVKDKLPVVSDQSGLPLGAHTQVLSSNDVSFIQTVAAQMKAKNVSVSGMTLPRTTGELDVQIGGQPYFVKYNLQSHTAKEQAGTYLATATQLQKQKVTPTQYIDVRVEGRAYYK